MADLAMRDPSSLAVNLDKGRKALADATDDFRRWSIRKGAKAVEAAALVLGRMDIQVMATELIQRAEREIAKNNPPAQGERTDIVPPGDEVAAINPSTLRNIRQAHAKVTDDQFEKLVSKAREEQQPLTRAAVSTGKFRANSTGDYEIYTPPAIVEAARLCMGGIDLDPLSSAAANEVVKATTHYTRDDDGFALPWTGRVFVNPPFASETVGMMTDKLALHEFDQCIVLVENKTETASGQWLFRASTAFCFPAKRVKYWKPDGTFHSSQVGATIYGLATDPAMFAEAFAGSGFVGRAWR